LRRANASPSITTWILADGPERVDLLEEAAAVLERSPARL